MCSAETRSRGREETGSGREARANLKGCGASDCHGVRVDSGFEPGRFKLSSAVQRVTSTSPPGGFGHTLPRAPCSLRAGVPVVLTVTAADSDTVTVTVRPAPPAPPHWQARATARPCISRRPWPGDAGRMDSGAWRRIPALSQCRKREFGIYCRVGAFLVATPASECTSRSPPPQSWGICGLLRAFCLVCEVVDGCTSTCSRTPGKLAFRRPAM
eukprot:3137929-Rhodomonas_salina.1